MPDLGQVPEHDPRIVTAGLMAVVALSGGKRTDLDEQVALPVADTLGPALAAGNAALGAYAWISVVLGLLRPG